MQYLVLAYGDEQRLAAMPAAERDALALAGRASDEALRASGYLLAAYDLRGSCAATVRLQGGRLALAPGPVAQARELLAVFIIRARDLNEAVLVAGRMPYARAGPVEVRPLPEIDE